MPPACRPFTSLWFVRCATPTTIACDSCSQLGNGVSSLPLAVSDHRPHRRQVVAPLSAVGTAWTDRSLPRPASSARQNSRRHRRTGRRFAPAVVHLRRPPSHPRVRSSAQPSRPGTHLAPAQRQRKYQRKQDLAHIKATWRIFQQISADTKDLNDIPRYWPQTQAFDLPAVEYTAREVRSGLLFWAFAQRRSAAASSVFAARIQQHLDRCGISLRDLVGKPITAPSSSAVTPAAAIPPASPAP